MTNCFIPASRKSRDKLLLDDGWVIIVHHSSRAMIHNVIPCEDGRKFWLLILNFSFLALISSKGHIQKIVNGVVESIPKHPTCKLFLANFWGLPTVLTWPL
jgi:hypothetical protein